MAEPFAQPLAKLGDSGIGVAAAPTGGMGIALDLSGHLTPPVISLENHVVGASADLTLGTTQADITGAALTLLTVGAYIVWAVIDFDLQVAGGGVAVGQLVSGSFVFTGNLIFTGAAGDRASVAQQWTVVTSDPNTVVKLQAAKTVAGGTIVAHQTHTTLAALRVA